MKKSLRAGMALTSLVFAAGLIFSGCLAISDEEQKRLKQLRKFQQVPSIAPLFLILEQAEF